MNVTPWLNTDTLKITSSSSNNSREKHKLTFVTLDIQHFNKVSMYHLFQK